MPSERNATRAHFWHRLELHDLLRTVADLEIGKPAAGSAVRHGIQKLHPSSRIAPAVVDVYPIDFVGGALVFYRISVDHHLVSGRVHLNRGAEIEIGTDGVPKVGISVAPVAHYRTVFKPVVFRLRAKLDGAAGCARLVAHARQRLHP